MMPTVTPNYPPSTSPSHSPSNQSDYPSSRHPPKHIDRQDQIILTAWKMGVICFTATIGLHSFGFFPVPARYAKLLDLALTSSALYCLAEAHRKHQQLSCAEYRNQAQRNLDEAVEETAFSHQLQIQHTVAQYQQEIDRLRVLNGEKQDDIDSLSSQLSALKAKKFHEEEQARADAEEAREYLDNDRAAIQQQRQELALYEQQLDSQRDELDALEHRYKQEATQVWEHQRDAIEQQMSQLNQREAELDALEQDYMEQAMAAAQEAVMEQIKGYQNAIDLLQEEVASFLCSTPIPGNSKEALIAQSVLDTLEQMQIYLRRTDYGYQGDQVWVVGDPLPTIGGEKIADPNMALAHIWDQLNKPKPLKYIQSRIAGCMNAPTITTDYNKRLKIEVDISPIDKQAVQAQQTLQETYCFPTKDEPALLAFIDTALHINFMAPSGRGKTTLIDNLINLLASMMGPDTQIRYANPKPDRKDHKFPITWIGLRESVYGLFEAAIEVRHRVDTNNRIQRQRQDAGYDATNKPAFQTWEQRLYFIDELNMIVGYFKGKNRDQVEGFFDTVPTRLNLDWKRSQTFEEMRTEINPKDVIADLIKFTWRVGRSEDIKLVMAGQNLMPSQISHSMTKYDAYGQAYIASGESAIQKVKTEGVIKTDIYDQCVKVIAAEEDKKIAPFWGVFAPARGSGKSFITEFPAPSTYDTEHDTESTPQVSVHHAQEPDMKGIDHSTHTSTTPSSDLSDIRRTLDEVYKLPNEPPEDNTSNDYSDLSHSVEHSQNPSESLEFLHSTPGFTLLSANMSDAFYTTVLDLFQTHQSIAKTIKELWGLSPNKYLRYQVAKWKIRHVLNTHTIQFESTTSTEDRKRDRMNYDQLIDYLEQSSS